MDKTKLISLLEQAGLAALASGASYLAAHGMDVDPTYGVLIGAVAGVVASWLNKYMNNPVNQIISLAFKKSKPVPKDYFDKK